MYVVATDKFMSGWGGHGCPTRSLIAIDCGDDEVLADQTARRLKVYRTDMQRVRINANLPRVSWGDHLAIYKANGSETHAELGERIETKEGG